MFRRIFSKQLTIMLTSLLAVAGCASNNAATGANETSTRFGAEKPTLSASVAASNIRYDLDKLWSASISGNADSLGQPYIAVRGDLLCAAASKEVLCVTAKTGDERWSADVRGITAGPAITRNLVIVGTDEGSLVALNKQNGEVRWVADVGAEVLAAPAVGKSNRLEVIAVRTASGRLVGINPADGSEMWAVEQKVPRLSQRGIAAPLVVADMAIAGFDNGRLAGVELATGKARWLAKIADPRGRNDLERLVDIDGKVAVSKTAVFASSLGGKTKAVDGRTGKDIWEQDVGSYQDLALTRSAVLLTENARSLVALDDRSGRINWRWQPEDEDLRLGAPAGYDLFALVGDNDGNLYGVSRVAGELRFEESVGGEIRQAPLVVDETIYIYSDTGSVSAYKLNKSSD